MVDATADGAVPDPDRGARMLYPMPGLELPIVVAARLSLSFPILLSTIPFWRAGRPGRPVRAAHDVRRRDLEQLPDPLLRLALPGRPTFGLDLQPWRDESQKSRGDVQRAQQGRFSEVRNVGTFFAQILNAARNWRDNMAELPGYRDRICQIRLTAEEGGLNLNMPSRSSSAS